MNWTKERPTDPGTYAWRDPITNCIDSTLIRIRLIDEILMAWIDRADRWHPLSEFADREWLKLPE
jgi:hypothetical protein